MSAELEPGAMGRLAVLIGEVRSLRAGAAELSSGADRLAAEVASVRDLQIQTLGFLQEMMALFSAPLTPVVNEESAYEPDAGPAGEGASEISDGAPVDDPEPEERVPAAAPAVAVKPRRRAK
ncbi:hypothetical protein [Rhizobium sp. RAF56]|uniref:hypothetical protein n=1 Tax=Rhizobium sp. RAF56 TaxID=3233062 RepID=UPI003F9E9CB6